MPLLGYDVDPRGSKLIVSEAEAARVRAIFDPVRDSLTPREQVRIVHLLVERADYDGAAGKVSITFHASGIRTLADDLARHNTEDAA
jgi:site-specific DNA recombinase